MHIPDRAPSEIGLSDRIEEGFSFLTCFLRQPRAIGSVAPSSRYLARQMVAPIDWTTAAAIAELGAGTGVFTREIARRVAPATDVYIFEQDAAMRRRLTIRFPDYHHRANALDLLATAGTGRLDAVLSGLPFANFPAAMRASLLDQVQAALRPDGRFIAFQYAPQLLPELRRRFSRVQLRWVALNLPPAFVYICER